LEIVADELLRRIATKNRLKIWDAGCSTGAEPFTFAIILAERTTMEFMRGVQIFATDIDELQHFRPLIESGIYPYEQLKRIPGELFQKYFIKTNPSDNFQLIPQIHNAVKFYKHNLLSLDKIDYNFDLVICKNVLLHFTANERINVLKMFYQSLNPNGLLVMEQNQKIPVELESFFRQLTPQAQLFGKI